MIAVLGSGSGEPTFEAVVAGYPVSIAVAAQERLSRLATVFQLVWATAWMEDAAEALGPVLGLPDDVPFLRFDPDADRDAPTYKLPVVKRFVRDRPVAWVDDELGEDVIAWADQREEPTLLVCCDPRVGLTDEDVDDLLAFASSVTDESTDGTKTR